MELAINFEQHKTVLISFTGEGYDPSQLEFDQPSSSLVSNNESIDTVIPSSSSSHLLTTGQVSHHGDINVFVCYSYLQVVKVSHEMISFGHFPLFATINRIIFLRCVISYVCYY